MKHVAISSAIRSSPRVQRGGHHDVVLTRDDIGLWALADGRGHAGGSAWASATMIEALARAAAQAEQSSLEDAVAEGHAEIASACPHGADMAAGGVAALRFDGMTVQGVSSGDGRIYRLRDGRMSMLGNAADSAAARPHDLFLLCSEGLCRSVPDATIQARLSSGVPESAADDLLHEAIAGGSTEQLSLVVVRIAGAGMA